MVEHLVLHTQKTVLDMKVIHGSPDGMETNFGLYIKTIATAGHTHDDRYYTESEMNTKLNGKANSSHTHNYAGSGSAGGTANSVNGLTFAAQTTDPGRKRIDHQQGAHCVCIRR